MQCTLCISCILCTASLSKSLLMLHVIMNSKTYSYLQHPRSNMAMPQKKLLFKFAFWKAEVERMRERPQDDLMQLVQCLRSIFLKKKRSILIFLSVHTISNFMFSDSDWNWVSTVYLPHFLQYSLVINNTCLKFTCYAIIPILYILIIILQSMFGITDEAVVGLVFQQQ